MRTIRYLLFAICYSLSTSGGTGAMSIIVEAAATFDGSSSQGHFAIPYFQIISNISNLKFEISNYFKLQPHHALFAGVGAHKNTEQAQARPTLRNLYPSSVNRLDFSRQTCASVL